MFRRSINASGISLSPQVFQVGFFMPRKIKELISDLEKAGFVNRGGKGSHRNYEHPRGARVTISGKLSDDAKPYQEREVKTTIKEVQQ
jgi:predicted RNA binding protein YcfA (HicA-like mRNA interferase family)